MFGQYSRIFPPMRLQAQVGDMSKTCMNLSTQRLHDWMGRRYSLGRFHELSYIPYFLKVKTVSDNI